MFWSLSPSLSLSVSLLLVCLYLFISVNFWAFGPHDGGGGGQLGRLAALFGSPLWWWRRKGRKLLGRLAAYLCAPSLSLVCGCIYSLRDIYFVAADAARRAAGG